MPSQEIINKEEKKTIDQNTKSINLVEIKPKGKYLFQKGHKKIGGKKKGTKNQKTLEKELAQRRMEETILGELKDLLKAQIQIAKGTIYIFKIVKTKKGGKEHILLTDPGEIKYALDEVDGEGTVEDGTYYYVATKQPDNRALDSLINRVFGKPKESVDFTSGGEPIGIIFLPRRKQDENKQLNESNELATPTQTRNSS